MEPVSRSLACKPGGLTQPEVARCAEAILAFSTLWEASNKKELDACNATLPGLSATECRERFKARHLLPIEPERSPVTRTLWQGVRRGVEEHSRVETGPPVAVGALTTIAVWRYLGGSPAWMERVGYIRKCTPAVLAGLRVMLLSLRDDPAAGDRQLYRGYSPPRLLHSLSKSRDAGKYAVAVVEALEVVQELAHHVFPTLAFLIHAAPTLPIAAVVPLLASSSRLGLGGASGRAHNGPFGAHPCRRPGFWTNLLIYDIVRSETVGWRPADALSWVASGPGTTRGILAASGRTGLDDGTDDGHLEDESRDAPFGRADADEAITQVARALEARGAAMAPQLISFAFCEIGKVYVRKPHLLRGRVIPGGVTDRPAADAALGRRLFTKPAARWKCCCAVCRQAAGAPGGREKPRRWAPYDEGAWCTACWKAQHLYAPH